MQFVLEKKLVTFAISFQKKNLTYLPPTCLHFIVKSLFGNLLFYKSVNWDMFTNLYSHHISERYESALYKVLSTFKTVEEYDKIGLNELVKMVINEYKNPSIPFFTPLQDEDIELNWEEYDEMMKKYCSYNKFVVDLLKGDRFFARLYKLGEFLIENCGVVLMNSRHPECAYMNIEYSKLGPKFRSFVCVCWETQSEHHRIEKVELFRMWEQREKFSLDYIMEIISPIVGRFGLAAKIIDGLYIDLKLDDNRCEIPWY